MISTRFIVLRKRIAMKISGPSSIWNSTYFNKVDSGWYCDSVHDPHNPSGEVSVAAFSTQLQGRTWVVDVKFLNSTFWKLVTPLLSDPRVEKVVFDGKHIADFLLHKVGIELRGNFISNQYLIMIEVDFISNKNWRSFHFLYHFKWMFILNSSKGSLIK